MGTCDSIRADIVAHVRADAALIPPEGPAPRLADWMILLLAYPDSGFVADFARKAHPETWADADTTGLLPLTAALALLESGLPDSALAWIDRGGIGRRDRSYAHILKMEAFLAAGDTAAALSTAAGIVAERTPRALAGAAMTLLTEDRERARDGQGLLALSLAMRRSLGRGPEETAARYRAYRLLALPGAMRGVGDTLLSEFPGTRTARVEALRRFREAPAHATRVEGRILLDVLLRHRQLDAADSLLSLMREPDSLRVVLLESYYQNRRYTEILEYVLEPSPRWSPDLKARFHLVRARAARNTGRWDTMVRHYEAAVLLGGETRRTALTELGREAESEQREAMADSVYTRLLALNGSGDEGGFRRALSRVARGMYREALVDLRRIGPGDFAVPAAFWRYRALESLGDSAGAALALREAAGGSGYYARRARRQLALGGSHRDFWPKQAEAMFPAEVRGDWEASDAGASCRSATRGAAAWAALRVRLFRRFGRAEWAGREQERLEAVLGAGDRTKTLRCLGLVDLSVRAAIRSGADAGSLRYPRPFYRAVVQEAGSAGLSPALVWAIARRESLFDPGAVSGAGARGLLQMMTPTAEETAGRWGIPSAPLERYDVNLALAVRHMRDLRDRHPAWHVPALLAAYNAGADKTGEWVSRFPDPDLLIERIGWRETRDYVRHVLDAFWIYDDSERPVAPAERP
jgi:soluble lytic murein transglycosylase-like protein